MQRSPTRDHDHKTYSYPKRLFIPPESIPKLSPRRGVTFYQCLGYPPLLTRSNYLYSLDPSSPNLYNRRRDRDRTRPFRSC